jgi:anti-sigma B factor antagonist
VQEGAVNVQSEVIDGIRVVVVPGDHVDAANARDVRAAIEAAMGDSANVVADLVNVSFVDSAGLGALLSLLRLATSRSGDFRLCRPSKAVRALLQLVRMHRVFSIFNTREEAVASYAEG